MLKNGDVSYWDTQKLKDYLAYAPEICFLMLGTNDTKPQNWDDYGDEFVGDYLAMIDTIKQRNPSTIFILAYPPPAFEVKWGIRDSIILYGVIPAIDSVLNVVDAELVDFYHPLLDSAHLFPDNIHPGVEGAGIMAQIILDKMIETDIIHRADTGLTFITGFETAKSPLRVNDSTTLSWTTINVDSIFLNGIPVDASGSLKISPTVTTTYTLIAKGEKSSDTIILVQEVYTPELARLRIYPAKITRAEDDTIFFQVFYHDQYNILIGETYYPVNWEIIDGSGYLYGDTDTSVYFVAEQPDTIELKVSYGEFSDIGTIYLKAVTTALDLQPVYQKLVTYPNPCSDILHVKCNKRKDFHILRIYNLKGSLIARKKLNRYESGSVYSLNISDLAEGEYIIHVESSQGIYSGRFSVVRN